MLYLHTHHYLYDAVKGYQFNVLILKTLFDGLLLQLLHKNKEKQQIMQLKRFPSRQ